MRRATATPAPTVRCPGPANSAQPDAHHPFDRGGEIRHSALEHLEGKTASVDLSGDRDLSIQISAEAREASRVVERKQRIRVSQQAGRAQEHAPAREREVDLEALPLLEFVAVRNSNLPATASHVLIGQLHRVQRAPDHLRVDDLQLKLGVWLVPGRQQRGDSARRVPPKDVAVCPSEQRQDEYGLQLIAGVAARRETIHEVPPILHTL